MPKDSKLNQFQTPIELAMKMISEQQERVIGQIMGPQRQQRITKIDGHPVDNIIDDVLMDFGGM
jgi:hypothetical protein